MLYDEMFPLGVVTVTVKVPPLCLFVHVSAMESYAASLTSETLISPKMEEAAEAGQPANPVRQPMVSGTVHVAGVGMEPLLVEKATVVPAGMAFPFESTTVTITVEGVFCFAPVVVQESNTIPVEGIPVNVTAGTAGAVIGTEAGVIEAS
jgi:hypothetical protein